MIIHSSKINVRISRSIDCIQSSNPVDQNENLGLPFLESPGRLTESLPAQRITGQSEPIKNSAALVNEPCKSSDVTRQLNKSPRNTEIYPLNSSASAVIATPDPVFCSPPSDRSRGAGARADQILISDKTLPQSDPKPIGRTGRLAFPITNDSPVGPQRHKRNAKNMSRTRPKRDASKFGHTAVENVVETHRQGLERSHRTLRKKNVSCETPREVKQNNEADRREADKREDDSKVERHISQGVEENRKQKVRHQKTSERPDIRTCSSLMGTLMESSHIRTLRQSELSSSLNNFKDTNQIVKSSCQSRNRSPPEAVKGPSPYLSTGNEDIPLRQNSSTSDNRPRRRSSGLSTGKEQSKPSEKKRAPEAEQSTSMYSVVLSSPKTTSGKAAIIAAIESPAEILRTTVQRHVTCPNPKTHQIPKPVGKNEISNGDRRESMRGNGFGFLFSFCRCRYYICFTSDFGVTHLPHQDLDLSRQRLPLIEGSTNTFMKVRHEAPNGLSPTDGKPKRKASTDCSDLTSVGNGTTCGTGDGDYDTYHRLQEKEKSPLMDNDHCSHEHQGSN